MPPKSKQTSKTVSNGENQAIFALHDNAPMLDPTQFGVGGTANYYHGDEPTPYMLAKMARFTPIGFRLTHGYASDLFNNQFGLSWPNERITTEDRTLRNRKFRQHMKAIKGFIECQKWVGFDREQGESLFVIYREGDGVADPNLQATANISMGGSAIANTLPNMAIKGTELANPTPPSAQLNASDPYGNNVQYYNFARPADISKRVIRVEAYNKINYSIPFINSFGQPEYYLINFYTRGNVLIQYVIHPSRVIRMKLYNINYEQWSGHGALKCCFPQLVILSNIDRMTGVAATRWAYQVPVFITRNLRTTQDQTTFATKLGNPSAATWMVIPGENVTDIKMIGPQTGIMRLDDFAQMMINEISAGTGFPATILMNQKVGVLGSGEVNLKEYFAKLDADHSLINPFIEQFIAIDPELREIVGEELYEIDWGIRHVMTEQDRVDLDVKKLANCNAMMGFSSLNEVRAYWGAEAWEKHLERLKLTKWAKDLYNDIPPEVLANVPIPGLGEWKQAFLQSILNPEEGNETGFGDPEAKTTSENLGKNEVKQTAAQESAKKQQDPTQREQERRRVMYEKQQTRRQGYDAFDIDHLTMEAMAKMVEFLRDDEKNWYYFMAKLGIKNHGQADRARNELYELVRGRQARQKAEARQEAEDEENEIGEPEEAPEPEWADEWKNWSPELPQGDEIDDEMLKWRQTKRKGFFMKPSTFHKISKKDGSVVAGRAYWNAVKSKWKQHLARKQKKDATVIGGFV